MDDFVGNLIDLLDDEDETIVTYAVRELRSHPGEGTEKALKSRLASVPVAIAVEMVDTLHAFHREDPLHLSDELMAAKAPALRVAHLERSRSAFGLDEHDRVLGWLERERDARCAAMLLSLLRDMPAPSTVRSRVSPYLSHVDARVRANAVEVVEAMGLDEGLELLLPLLDDDSPRVRANACRACWKDRASEIALRLEGELASRDIRRELSALYVLGKLAGDAASLETLKLRIDHDSEQVRLLAARGLCNRQDELDVAWVLRRYLDEPISTARRTFASMLRRCDREGLLVQLETILGDELRPGRERADAARAMGLLQDPRTVPSLLRCLHDGDDRVRANVVDALAECGSAHVAELLVPLLADPTPRVAANAATAIWRLGGQGAMRRLVHMLESSDASAQASAAYALGEIGTMQVIGPLTEALHRLSKSVVRSALQERARENLVTALGKIRSSGEGAARI